MHISADFVVVITGRQHRGQLLGHDVYRATDFKVLPLTTSSSLYQNPVESHLLDLVRSHLFSATRGILLGGFKRKGLCVIKTPESLSGKSRTTGSFGTNFFIRGLLKRRFPPRNSIDLFYPSYTAVCSLINLSHHLHIYRAAFDTCDAVINSRAFTFTLISRRSRYRAGTRYFTRGIDDRGNVANYNESEQIAIVNNSSDDDITIFSFVQTRGSIPVFWAEINNLRYKPDLQIMELKHTAEALELHFKDQLSRYGTQRVVNLVKQNGHEKPVKEAYERYLSSAKIPDVNYDYFDFSRECRNMQWQRIDILIDRIKNDLIQKRARTSELAERSNKNELHGQPGSDERGPVCSCSLDPNGAATSGKVGGSSHLDERKLMPLNTVWTDHADSISRAYSGTGALKTDFTRTGKRTLKGLLQDGVNSLTRYMKNNHFDGTRQDGFDIVTGAWTPGSGTGVSRNLLLDSRPLLIQYSLIYYFSIWIALAVISLAYIVLNGVQYVSWPRLNPPLEAIYYTGPGFRSARHGLGTLVQRGGAIPPKHRADIVELNTFKKRID
ncbi:hypothetical protein Clacol_010383 [Clathrus columnatus]|uniref:SAC domain-containing protein n=1 Tax=Clathrus columnatus TaxID=1419009 RepID=A0AAV5ATL9_9AGAM|nr:hypothetical protein Clacol_010383 [Clathrus columnatus]